MQMARLAAAAVTAPKPAAGSAWRFANLQRTYQCVKALGKQFVHLCDHTPEFSTIEMALHHAHQVLYQ